jgi:hypothetical protein
MEADCASGACCAREIGGDGAVGGANGSDGLCGDGSFDPLSDPFINSLQSFHEQFHEITDFRDIKIFGGNPGVNLKRPFFSFKTS